MVDTSGEDCNRGSNEDMVSIDKDTAICVIHNKMPNALEKKILLTVRQTHTVADLFSHAKCLLRHPTFELMLCNPDSGLDAVYLSALSDRKLPDVGVIFDPPGFRNTLHLMPMLEGSIDAPMIENYNFKINVPEYEKQVDTEMSCTNEQFSDDELALGASASPTEPDTSVNYCNNSNNSSNGSNPRSNPAMIPAVPMIENVDYSLGAGTSDYKAKLYSEPRPALGYVGLVNQAMTCYLNSLLQALFMTPEFRNALYNWEFDGIQETKSIPYQLQKLFLNLQTSPKVAVETTDLTKSFGWDSTDSWQQHDIQELCRVMFDALEQKFKNTKQADLINCLYEGKMTDYVKCLECQTEKSRSDTFLDIPLPVRPFGSTVAYSSVEEALRAFVQPETLDGNNQYFCEKCNKKCDAHKGLKFAKFPYILTLHLKRFDFDYSTLHRIKLNDKVTFPQTLDLNSFVKESSPVVSATSPESGDAPPSEHESVESAIRCDDCSTTDSGSALEEDSSCNGTNFTAGSNNNDPDLQDDDEGIDMSASTDHKASASGDGSGPYIYELFAIMIHSGSASGGHYYAYIRDFENSEWYCFNDQSVTGITQEDIQKSFGGGSSRAFYSGAYSSSTNAYMLMYRQMDPVKNARAIKADTFPPHIIHLLCRLKEKEEVDKRRKALDLTTLKQKVYYFSDVLQRMTDTKVYISADSTLTETVEEACTKLLNGWIIPIERCRLVAYDHEQEHIGRSLEGREQDQIGDIMNDLDNRNGVWKPFKDLLLEVREEGKTFEVYTEESIYVKVYLVDLIAVDIDGPYQVRTMQSKTIGRFKQQLAEQFSRRPETITLIVQQANMAVSLDDDESTLLKAQILASCKICVVTKADDIVSRFRNVFNRLPLILTLFVVLPIVDKSTLEEMAIPPYEPHTNLVNGITTNGVTTPTKSLRHSTHFASSVDVVDAMMVSPPLISAGPSEVTESNSEDSSLSDGDRTLVEPILAGDISSDSNSPASCSDKQSSLSRAFYTTDGDTEMTDISKGYFFKAVPFNVTPVIDGVQPQTILKVLVDSGMSVEQFKRALEPFVQVPMEYFKIFHTTGLQTSTECRLSESLFLFRESERFIIQLGRALRLGEYKVKIYFLKLSEVMDEMEGLPFLCQWIVQNGRTVGDIKRELIEHLSTRNDDKLHLTYEKCRLRKKNWRNPVQVYMDDMKFDDDISLSTSSEFILQEIEDIVQPLTDCDDLVVFVRRWSPSKLELGAVQEITITKNNELREILSAISGIPTERIEYAKASGQFPRCNLSVLTVHSALSWKSIPVTLDSSQITISQDGNVCVYRDSEEELKELTSDERRELSSTEVRFDRMYSSSTYSPRRERALKIYLDSSPKKQDE